MSTPGYHSGKCRALLALALSLAAMTPPTAALAQPPAAGVQREVNALFRTLERSDCQFNRNGTWYGGKQAAVHLRRKYDYLHKKGQLTTTEAFIENAASRSSMSGQAYLVRCGGKPAAESRSWFMTQLGQLRTP